MAKSIAVLDRLMAKVRDTPTGCWEFTGYLNTDGYGRMYYQNGRYGSAHRISYQEFIGPIPDGLVIDHLCRNRACVNPDHLEPVTQQVNVLRGDGPAAKCAAKTHCAQGHPYDEQNTIVNNKGDRLCRICRKASKDRTLAKRREANRLAGRARNFTTPRTY